MSRKEIQELKHKRVKAELTLKLIKFIDGFKSKEEPSIKLNLLDKAEVLSGIVTKVISRLENPKK